MKLSLSGVFALLFLLTRVALAERLKDIADLSGARRNQLLGYGLVVGLPNTGDNFYAGLGMQSVANMLRYLGVNIDPNSLRLMNVAAVMVTSEIPTFMAPGQRLDVVVSSMGNARSLEGGTLVSTHLKGSDGKTYALAQGPLSVGGFYVAGLSQSRMQRNFTNVGRIPNGAVVEREVPVDPVKDFLEISLKIPDFTTAVRLAQVISQKMQSTFGEPPSNPNQAFVASSSEAGGGNGGESRSIPWAQAKHSGTVLLKLPQAEAMPIPEVMAMLENLPIQIDVPARVIINERTGTVVLGESVRLSTVAVAHGNLTLEINEQPLVSQPGAFSSGTTEVVPQTTITASETDTGLRYLNPGASLGEVVKALNTLGVSPRDLISILQALKSAGALRGEVEIQ